MSTAQDGNAPAKAGADEVETDEQIWAELMSAKPADEDADDEAGDEDQWEKAAAEGEEEADEDAEKADAEGAETPEMDASEGSDDLDPVALKTQNDRLEKKFRSEQNRAKGQQRRADRLQQELDELKQKLEAKTAPSEEDQRAHDDARARVLEEYGDVVSPIFKEVDRLRDQITELSESDKRRLRDLEDEIADHQAAEMDKLTEEHPDGLKVISDNADLFRQWIDDQPKMYRDIFEANRKRMVDGVGTALLVSRFKGALLEARHGQVDEHADGGDVPPQSEDRLSAKRRQQLAGATTTSSRRKSTKVVSDEPGEEASAQELWDHFRRVDKRKARDSQY